MTYRSNHTSPHRRWRAIALAAAALVFTRVLIGCHADAEAPGAEAPAGPDGPAAVERPRLSLLSYNVQNLFDDRDDGTEYDAFRASSGWDRERYYGRLERTEAAIRLAAGALPGGRLPDVLVLQELESARVAADLARDFLRRYRHIAAGPAGTTTTQVVILSRHRPALLRAHGALVVRDVPDTSARGLAASSFTTVWRGRDTVEVRLSSPDLVLLAAHWKSQSGGEAPTEYLRRLEAALARALTHDWYREEALRAPAAGGVGRPPLLLVGDLNEDLHEYQQHGGAYPTALLPARAPPDADSTERAAGDGERVPGGSLLFVSQSTPEAPSPGRGPSVGAAELDGSLPHGTPVFRTLWDSDSGRGTYHYRGQWERLDHAMLLAGPSWTGSLVVADVPGLVDTDGRPLRYQAWTGQGISDHVPIAVSLYELP